MLDSGRYHDCTDGRELYIGRMNSDGPNGLMVLMDPWT